MNNRQKAALEVVKRFVTSKGGDPAEIVIEDGAYRWTAPDGRVAHVGWKP